MEIKLTKGVFNIRKRLLINIMRTFIFLFCATVFSITPNNVLSQNTKIKIDTDQEVTIDEVFDMITKQTEYAFMYQDDLFNGFPKVQLKKGIIRMDKLINQSLSSGNLNVVLTKNNTILIKEAKTIQQRQVIGKITDEAGLPIPGVTVLIKGTTNGTASAFDGTYNITVSDPANVLVFSSLGFQTQEITVGSQTVINIVLKEDVSELDEVTINAGYYKTSQKLATGNIAKMEAKAIEKQPVNNPLAAMQGHLSGVNITQNTGLPGGGYTIEIRGKNFINGSTNPLFIVDGVPYGSESLATFDVSGQILNAGTSPLNAINPADIESIEVLKDADATAIYGSRGANGVVLITTKKGKAGKTQFNANVSSSMGQVSHFRDLMKTEEYLEVRREAVNNDGFGAFLDNPGFDFFWPDLKTWDQDRYTDWQEELIGGTAYRNNAQLSVSGGSAQTQFLVSGSYQKETTVFPGDANYKKGSVHTNINHQSKDNRFKINFSTNYTVEDNQLPRVDLTSSANSLEPNAPALYDEEGNINWENDTFSGNPAAYIEQNYRAKTNTLIANTVVSYQIIPNVELKTNLGYNNSQLNSYNAIPFSTLRLSFLRVPEFASLTTNNTNRQSWIVEPQINWQQQWGDSKLNVLVGTTFQQESTDQFVLKGMGFSSNNLILNMSAAQTLESLQDTDSEYNYQAFFGRINYNYKDKYILNVTGRRDGSSRFGPDKQFGNFGAVGGAWIFSKETFLKDNSVLTFGKIRASYGTTGSDNIGDYKFLDTYSISSDFNGGNNYNGVIALQPTGLFNPLLAWESNKKMEVALELGFFKNRIWLNTAWYQNRSSNQLIGIPLPNTTGFSVIEGNLDATVQNTGFEVDLNTVNFQNKNFSWTTTFNITVPKNKLVKFPGLESSTFANKFVVGKPITNRNLYHALGVDPDTGLYQFEDFNGDGNITSIDDAKLSVDLTPKFYGGLGNTFTYKNFTLDAFFQFKKQKGFNYLSGSILGFRSNAPAKLLDNYWQQPGDISEVQRATIGLFPGAATASFRQGSSDAAVTDASFIRLRNISLTYKVPTSKGIDISLYIQGQNLLTITSYDDFDPEYRNQFTLPPLKQFTLGLQLGF